MASTRTRFAALGLILAIVSAQDDAGGPFNFCQANTCEECPVSLTSAGTGYPNCVIYNSADVLPNADPPFNGSVGGGWTPYLNVSQPDPECHIIVKTPADVNVPGCGDPIAAFGSHTCAATMLKDTFIVQYCCGTDDCNAAGVVQKRTDGRSGGIYLQHPNGAVIQPAQGLFKRDDSCTENSWVADADKGEYTRPSDSSQIVYTGIAGGQSVTITKECSTSFTQSLMAGLTFEEIFNIGVSFSITEEMSESTARMFTAPEGQSGNVVFTANLRCSTGTGTCDGGSLHGEICTPFDEGGTIDGQYTVVVTD